MKLYHRWFRILDVHAGLFSDRREVIRAVEDEYGIFASPGPASENRFTLEARLGGENPSLSIDGVISSLHGSARPVFFVLQAFIRTLSERVKAFHLLHAAVVKKDGNLLVLAGPPNIGKTTLARALLKQGWSFFSDDYCPLHRKTGRVHPFPRALHESIHPGKSGGVSRGPGPGGKVSVSPRDACDRVGGAPARPTAVVYLAPGVESSPDAGGGDGPGIAAESRNAGEQVLVLLGKAGAAPRVDELIGRLKGFSPRPLDLGDGNWKIAFRSEPASVSTARQWIRENRPYFWSVFRETPGCPDFLGEPHLSPLALSEAVLLLLQEMKHQDIAEGQAETGPESAHPPGRLFFELLKALSGVPCWRLRVGRLDPSTHLISSLTRPA